MLVYGSKHLCVQNNNNTTKKTTLNGWRDFDQRMEITSMLAAFTANFTQILSGVGQSINASQAKLFAFFSSRKCYSNFYYTYKKDYFSLVFSLFLSIGFKNIH